MVFQFITIAYLTILVGIVLVMFKRSTDTHMVIMKLYADISKLVSEVREEIHESIDSALKAHVKKYHS